MKQLAGVDSKLNIYEPYVFLLHNYMHNRKAYLLKS